MDIQLMSSYEFSIYSYEIVYVLRVLKRYITEIQIRKNDARIILDFILEILVCKMNIYQW